MKIWVYTVAWNEEVMLPYFLRHYGPIADRIVVYDNESDDRTVDLARAWPKVEVRSFGTGGRMCDDVQLDIKNHDWKECRGEADWVIVADVDEILWHPDLVSYLAECRGRGVTVLAPTGYEMLADAPPTGAGQLYDEIVVGAVEPFYAKKCAFDPSAIVEMNYGPGCHEAAPEGRVVYGRSPELKLLHYRYLGEGWIRERWRARAARLSERNRRMGWSVHYLAGEEQARGWVEALRRRSGRVVRGDKS